MRSRDSGFTLLEALVALVIAAIALDALFSGAIGGLRSVDVADHYLEAVSRARSHLAAIGVGATLTAARRESGDDGGGFTWRIAIVPEATSLIDRGGDRLGAQGSAPGATGGGLAGGPATITLYDVAVTIGWSSDGHARAVTLHTERIGASPAAAPGRAAP